MLDTQIFEPRRTEIITIVALGPSCLDWVTANYTKFPIEDEQVWTLNAGVKLFRHDVMWDMHTEEWLEARKDRLAHVQARHEWMRNHDRPIVMPRHDPLIPMSRTFPLKQVIEATQSNYFSTGPSYMLAMAYMLKPLTLRLFGCDFSFKRETRTHPDEVGAQCCAYWIGRIKEAGIKVEITTNTHFLDMNARAQGYLYGYHELARWAFPEGGQGVGTFTGPDYTTNDHRALPGDDAATACQQSDMGNGGIRAGAGGDRTAVVHGPDSRDCEHDWGTQCAGLWSRQVCVEPLQSEAV